MGLKEQFQSVRAISNSAFHKSEEHFPVKQILYNVHPNAMSAAGGLLTSFAAFLQTQGHMEEAFISRVAGGIADIIDGQEAIRQGGSSFGAFLDATLDRHSDLVGWQSLKQFATTHKNIWGARAANFASKVSPVPSLFRAMSERENKISQQELKRVLTDEEKIQMPEQSWGSRLIREIAKETVDGVNAVIPQWGQEAITIGALYVGGASVVTSVERGKILITHPHVAKDGKKHMYSTLFETFSKSALTHWVSNNDMVQAASIPADYTKVKAENATGIRANWSLWNVAPHAILGIGKVIMGDKFPQAYAEKVIIADQLLTVGESFAKTIKHNTKYPPTVGKNVSQASES